MPNNTRKKPRACVNCQSPTSGTRCRTCFLSGWSRRATCGCGSVFKACDAVIKRGGGRHCSKRCAMIARGKSSFEDRFWPKVAKSDGCWKWLGAKDHSGYGLIRSVGGPMVRAHRASWELHFQSPGDACVLHKCDTPECVRPDHLFVGSNKENTDDKVRKGRQASGNGLPQSKITPTIASEMRSKFSLGISRAEIAREYSVSWSTVDSVVKFETWKTAGA